MNDQEVVMELEEETSLIDGFKGSAWVVLWGGQCISIDSLVA